MLSCSFLTSQSRSKCACSPTLLALLQKAKKEVQEESEEEKEEVSEVSEWERDQSGGQLVEALRPRPALCLLGQSPPTLALTRCQHCHDLRAARGVGGGGGGCLRL